MKKSNVLTIAVIFAAGFVSGYITTKNNNISTQSPPSLPPILKEPHQIEGKAKKTSSAPSDQQTVQSSRLNLEGLSTREANHLRDLIQLGNLSPEELTIEANQALSMPASASRNNRLKSIFQALAYKSPEQAITQSLYTQGIERSIALEGTMSGWVIRSKDNPEPWNWINKNRNAVTSSQHMAILEEMSLKAASQESSMENLVENITDLPTNEQNWILSNYAESYDFQSFEEVNSLLQKLTQDSQRKATFGDLAFTLAGRDPNATIQWGFSLEEPEKSQAVMAGVTQLLSSTPETPSDFPNLLESLPEDTSNKLLDNIAIAYANNMSFKDPTTALEAYDSISDPNIRDQQLTRKADLFIRRTPEIALEYAYKMTDENSMMHYATSAYFEILKAEKDEASKTLKSDPNLTTKQKSEIASQLGISLDN